jgi:DNA helicase-2/ATP-dependent DNA helicase PcrA
VFTKFESTHHQWSELRTGSEELDALLVYLADPKTPWDGQLERVRAWYEPQLERLYDAAQVRAGDLLQLERIASQFSSREAFLTEMALDPPQATSDLSGAPYLDEDYLVLSTVHSAKGQEWDAVHVLNVADGNFPSEFSTGRADLIEEERRLLYVAMTRAKTDLHLIAPLKYYVTQQSRMGDRHVYGAKSRFLTAAVMACLEPVAFGDTGTADAALGNAAARVDVAGRLRAMWT